ncbi:MAG: bifunctional N-acetylglucosamine-1-phosphate uridyltransferase/glucosamine-1-phosphate acetyltransferase [Planctomycetota bacterium]
MSKSPLAVFILAAGKGTRTKLPTPKVLLPICGSSLLACVLDTAGALEPAHTVVVLSHGKESILESMGARLDGCLVVDQGEPRGTGHAVARGLEALDREAGKPFLGNLLVLYGDCPLMGPDTLLSLLHVLDGDGDRAAASLLTSLDLPTEGLGRILRNEDGDFLGIREEQDCSPEQLDIEEVNTGFCCFRLDPLREALPRLGNDNRQGEFYLTDVFALLMESGRMVHAVIAEDPDEVLGVNGLTELAQTREIMQTRILLEHMNNGVMIEDPATVLIERDVEIGQGTRILPFVVMRNGVRIGKDCEVGPFTHLRTGAALHDEAEVGNFVEMKKACLGSGSKAKHLSYLGDASIGSGTNIGAGTITANYDGKLKHRTVIGDNSFIGSGTIIVAPAEVQEGAATGAGAVLTHGTRVPPGAVFVGVPARPLRKAGQASAEEPSQEGQGKNG